MKTKVLSYRVLVEKERQNRKDVYVAYVPALGISDFGNSVDEAVKNAGEAIKIYLETLVDLDRDIPSQDLDDFYVGVKSIQFSGGKIAVC